MVWNARSMAESLDWEWSEKQSEYQGLCPIHVASGTHKYNAGIKDGRNEGVVVFHCFSNCNPQDFFKEMENRGFAREKKNNPEKAIEIERYEYQDENGNHLFYNIRYNPKTFKMAVLDKNGRLDYSTKSLTRRVIYRLPKILETTHTIFFVEGEKDVHTLERLGVVATCIAGGASAWGKWAAHYIKQLAGQDIVILPDNDAPGKSLANEVKSSLERVAKRIRILNLPGIKEHGDATDWVRNGGTVEELWRLVEEIGSDADTGIVEIEATELMKMQFKPLRWFASGLLHEGMVLFGGKSKRGKSWIMMNLSISIATGGPAFGYYEVPTPSKVLYCALEDGPRRTQRRLRMIEPNADLSKIKFAFRMPPLEQGGIDYIARHIKEGFEVIIVDVLAHIETAGKNGMKDYLEVYRTFAPLQQLRANHAFAIVMVTHLRKAESEDVFDNLHGSVAYQGAQDALWVLDRKHTEQNALLHIRDKDAEDKITELQFDGSSIWSFVGEGEEHAATKEEDRVIKFLIEENEPQSIKDIMQGLGIRPEGYAAFRVRLHRMVSKQIILRSDRGKYIALRKNDDYGF